MRTRSLLRRLAAATVFFTTVTGSLALAAPAAVAADGGPTRSICFPVVEPVSYIDDFGAPRPGGLTHEGNDLMGKKLYHEVAPVSGVIVDLRGPGTTSSGFSVRMRGDDGWYYVFIHVNNDRPGTDDGAATPLQAFAPGLAVGQRVVAGQFLAYMGDSGDAENTGPHLHFEMREPASTVWAAPAVDPYNSLQAATHCGALPVDHFRGVPIDRDGDTVGDGVVLRPQAKSASYTWYWNQTRAGYRTDTWGQAGDVLVPGDYDADGRTDPAIWRPTTGTFWVQQSWWGSAVQQRWGEAGDVPVPGDYDGDGRTDVAVYRPGTPSTWYVLLANGAAIVQQWGQEGDTPVAADYDGDGRTDVAIRRSEVSSTWFWISGTSSGFRLEHFGAPTDHVVPGDFDGDGHDDIVVTRVQGTTLVWYLLASHDGVSSTAFGDAATDTETPFDDDGDGKIDIAIWRSTSPGAFFALDSAGAKMRTFAWGEPGDTPLAHALVR